MRFTHTEGYNGATVSRVALVWSPKDHPQQRTEVAVDKHHGVIGYTPKDPIYTLQLPAYDDTLSYFVIADLHAPHSSDKPVERRGCNGSITLWKVRQPGEATKPLPLLPMSQSEKARYDGPK